jgi:hypothetical protein
MLERSMGESGVCAKHLTGGLQKVRFESFEKTLGQRR